MLVAGIVGRDRFKELVHCPYSKGIGNGNDVGGVRQFYGYSSRARFSDEHAGKTCMPPDRHAHRVSVLHGQPPTYRIALRWLFYIPVYSSCQLWKRKSP